MQQNDPIDEFRKRLRLGDFSGAYNALKERGRENREPSLADRFVAPPLTLLNKAAAYWRDLEMSYRWIDRGGRDDLLLGKEGLYTKDGAYSGTSQFSPALCHIVYSWFTKPGTSSNIYDPFCGGPERGAVAIGLGHSYTGVDIRKEQIEHNRIVAPNGRWVQGDSVATKPERIYDLVFTCPPYWNMERYSDSPRDLSNFTTYNAFILGLDKALHNAAMGLKRGGFFVLVVGDIRGKDGFLLPFVNDCERILSQSFKLVNRLVISGNATAAARAARPFLNSRILTNVNQYVLVFYNGDKLPRWGNLQSVDNLVK